MKLKFTSLVCCMLAAMTLSAQDVDKATVQAQAAAAEGAQAGLKGIDTGEKAWKFGGSLGLNAAATGLWNWAAGGNNNVNGVVYGRFRLLYHENSIAWDTNLDMEYGLTWIDQKYDKLQKSSDKINFATKFGWEFEKSWYLTALGSFNTQFAYGRNYNGAVEADPIISKFMAPGYVDLSLGIDWKPNDIFSIYLSPVAGRMTTVCVGNKLNNKYADEFAGAIDDNDLEHQLKNSYGVWKYVETADGKLEKSFKNNCRAELGLSFKGAINYKYKDLTVNTTLGLFTPYQWKKVEVYQNIDELDTDNFGAMYADSKHDAKFQDTEKFAFVGWQDNKRRFGLFDVDWTVNLGYQFLKCLQVTLSTDLRYYNGVLIADKEGNNPKERVQFKGVIGVGVGYSF